MFSCATETLTTAFYKNMQQLRWDSTECCCQKLAANIYIYVDIDRQMIYILENEKIYIHISISAMSNHRKQ